MSSREWRCDCTPDAAAAWLDAVTEFALGGDEIAIGTIGAAVEHYLVAIARHQRQRSKVGEW